MDGNGVNMNRYIKELSTGKILISIEADSFPLTNAQEFLTSRNLKVEDYEIGEKAPEVIDEWWQTQNDSAMTYADKRKAEYPSLESVTVAMAEKLEGNSVMWDEITKQRQDIKDKYPKG